MEQLLKSSVDPLRCISKEEKGFSLETNGAGDPESATDFCLYRGYVFVTGGSRGDDDPPPE